MRRLALLLLASTALVLSGCGGDDGKIEAKGGTDTTAADSSDSGDDGGDGGGDSSSGSSADADAIAKSLTDSDMGVDAADAQCAADKMADGLSADGIDSVSKDDRDLSDLSDADQQVVVDAFNECIDISLLAGPAMDAFAESSGIDLTEEESACAAEALGDSIGGSGDFLMMSMSGSDTETASQFVEVIGGCLNTDTLVAFMTTTFSSSGSMDEATAGCIANELVGQFGGTELLKGFVASADGSMPADLESALNAAGATCGAATGADVGAGIGQ